MESRMKLPLFDDYWIDFRCNTDRRWFSPEPWGLAPAGVYGGLIYDPERGKYRLYNETLLDIHDGPRHLRLYESDDLKTFTPVLTERGDNVVFTGAEGVHGSTVMFDPYDPNASRRYKYCGMAAYGQLCKTTHNEIPVELAFSADGVHWRWERDVAHPYTSDAMNKLFYNPVLQEYVLFFRGAFVDRRICMKTSKDLVHWSEPRVILQPGPNYNDGAHGIQHYSMTARYLDGIFYGLVWRYTTCLYDRDFTRMFGYNEPELVYSYDGRDFLYTTGRPLMDRPLPPSPGCEGLGPVDLCESADGQDYFIMCHGTNITHSTRQAAALLKEKLMQRGIPVGGAPIYRIRKDGFCGIESVGRGGLVVTKGVELLQDDLSFNLRADVGSVRFGLMDLKGNYLDGFSLDDCVPYEYANSVDVRPIWKEKTLSQALHRQVRIVVELNTAILHCITASARPYIRQAQRSFADPMGIPDAELQAETRIKD